jgi:hypothetical protein
LHQLETIKIMLVNRHEQHKWSTTKRPVAEHSHDSASQPVRAGI